MIETQPRRSTIERKLNEIESTRQRRHAYSIHTVCCRCVYSLGRGRMFPPSTFSSRSQSVRHSALCSTDTRRFGDDSYYSTPASHTYYSMSLAGRCSVRERTAAVVVVVVLSDDIYTIRDSLFSFSRRRAIRSVVRPTMKTLWCLRFASCFVANA